MNEALQLQHGSGGPTAKEKMNRRFSRTSRVLRDRMCTSGDKPLPRPEDTRSQGGGRVRPGAVGSQQDFARRARDRSLLAGEVRRDDQRGGAVSPLTLGR